MMEAYCLQNPGVTFFSRPVYADESAHPALIEVGVLKIDGEFWIETLQNRQEL